MEVTDGREGTDGDGRLIEGTWLEATDARERDAAFDGRRALGGRTVPNWDDGVVGRGLTGDGTDSGEAGREDTGEGLGRDRDCRREVPGDLAPEDRSWSLRSCEGVTDR